METIRVERKADNTESVKALVDGHLYSTYEASGRTDRCLAYLKAGETYDLDHMLSYFSNWFFEPIDNQQ